MRHCGLVKLPALKQNNTRNSIRQTILVRFAAKQDHDASMLRRFLVMAINKLNVWWQDEQLASMCKSARRQQLRRFNPSKRMPSPTFCPVESHVSRLNIFGLAIKLYSAVKEMMSNIFIQCLTNSSSFECEKPSDFRVELLLVT